MTIFLLLLHYLSQLSKIMNNRNAEKLDNDIPVLSPELLSILLKDHTTGGDIFWATDNYANRGDGYQYFDQIKIEAITGNNDGVIIPRSEKTKLQQKKRSREMAEIFTPSWVCNKMINLLDERWFERTETWTNAPCRISPIKATSTGLSLLRISTSNSTKNTVLMTMKSNLSNP